MCLCVFVIVGLHRTPQPSLSLLLAAGHFTETYRFYEIMEAGAIPITAKTSTPHGEPVLSTLPHDFIYALEVAGGGVSVTSACVIVIVIVILIVVVIDSRVVMWPCQVLCVYGQQDAFH